MEEKVRNWTTRQWSVF